jgi:hypothetical protein
MMTGGDPRVNMWVNVVIYFKIFYFFIS